MMLIHQAAASGFKTRAYSGVTLNMASVSNGAFITRVSGSIPFARFINRKITLSYGGKSATGYIKSIGTGETYDSDLVATNPGFDTDTGWTKGAGFSISGGVCTRTNTGGNSACTQSGNTITGAVYKVSADIIATLGTLYWLLDTAYRSLGTSTGNSILYWTAIANGTSIGPAGANGTAGSWDNVSMKRVLTPDSTGCVIVSTHGGTTQSWESNNGIFTYAPSFTVTISAQ